MSLTPINATETTTVAASDEITLDRWHLVNLQIKTPDPNGETMLIARFRKGNKDAGGNWTLAERSEETTATLRINDLQAQAASDSDLEDVLNSVISALITKGNEAGIL